MTKDMVQVAKSAIESVLKNDTAMKEAMRDVLGDMGIDREEIANLDNEQASLFLMGIGVGAAYWWNCN